MTGLVGFGGGIGGFYLASSLGFAKQLTGSFQPGFLIFAGLALVALAGLTMVKGRWRATWGAAARACGSERSSGAPRRTPPASIPGKSSLAATAAAVPAAPIDRSSRWSMSASALRACRSGGLRRATPTR